jgi:hypothetical protein
VRIDVPRDRAGTFEPQIVKKRQRRLNGVDEIVLSLYAKGLTTGEICAHFAEIYGASVSKETISRITDKVIEEMTDWAHRPLETVYAAVCRWAGNQGGAHPARLQLQRRQESTPGFAVPVLRWRRCDMAVPGPRHEVGVDGAGACVFGVVELGEDLPEPRAGRVDQRGAVGSAAVPALLTTQGWPLLRRAGRPAVDGYRRSAIV